MAEMKDNWKRKKIQGTTDTGVNGKRAQGKTDARVNGKRDQGKTEAKNSKKSQIRRWKKTR